MLFAAMIVGRSQRAGARAGSAFRGGWHTLHFVRITYDATVDAAYIYLTNEELAPGRDSIPCDPPDGMQAFVVLDWKDAKIVGIEVLDASKLLHQDLLAEAER